MSAIKLNILPQPIDFTFPFIEYIPTSKDDIKCHYECSATCRTFDGNSQCGLLIWNIVDVGSKTKLKGELYATMKDKIMGEFDSKASFKRHVILHLEDEINKVRGNQLYSN